MTREGRNGLSVPLSVLPSVPLSVLPSVATALLALLLAGGCTFSMNTRDPVDTSSSRASGAGGYLDDRSVVPVTTTKIAGKNVFIPSTIVVTEGSGRTLSFYNTTDTPHGFRIPGLGVEAILPPGQEFLVVLPPLTGEAVYEVQCHLHPPHRGATLVVLPRR